MRKGLIAAIAIAVSAAAATPAVAQAAPPTNDDFAAAAPLGVGQELSGSNLDATGETGEPDNHGASKAPACADIADGPSCTTSVWYLFEPPSNGSYVVETCDMGTDMDTVLGVYTGATVAAAAVVTSNDDGEACPGGGVNFGSRAQFMAGPGTPYRIAVTGFGGDEGSFYIRLYAGLPQSRPKPDTRIVRRTSLFAAKSLGLSSVVSGPRHSASFPLESDQPGAVFECSLDGAAYTTCESPLSYAGLAPGTEHVFAARASAGGSTDPTPAIQRFTLDPTAPETSIIGGPSGPLASQEAIWTSAPGERINSGAFSCQIDGQPLTTLCERTSTYTDLCRGRHVFDVAAIDRAANFDPTPAGAQIDVTVGPGCASPTIGPPEPPTVFPTTALVKIPYDDKGAGGTVHLEYGRTAAYGMEGPRFAVSPNLPSSLGVGLQFLTPNTEYHFRVTMTTPFGNADTGDQTLTTKPLEGTLPVVQNNGAPRAGFFAAALPLTIDAGGVDTSYAALIATGGPITGDEPYLFSTDVIPGAGSGPQPREFQVADLEPGTTYNYRIAAFQSGPAGNTALGPEGTFTTPTLPVNVQAVAGKKRFRLRKGQVKVKPLTRRSRKLRVRVRGLPVGSKVKLRLRVGKKKQTARKKARRNGIARFNVSLSKRIRKSLLDEKVKRYALRVTAIPPVDPPSSVTIRKRIRKG